MQQAGVPGGDRLQRRITAQAPLRLAMQRKQDALGWTLRQVAQHLGLSFWSVSRFDRREGGLGLRSRLRLQEWLGESIEGSERSAWVHVRSAAPLDTATGQKLLDVAGRLQGSTGVDMPVRRALGLREAGMEAMAGAFRAELGLTEDDALDPLRIAVDGVEVVEEAVGSGVWALMAVPIDAEHWVVVRNAEYRYLYGAKQAFLEELWHILLCHKLRRVVKSAPGVYSRDFGQQADFEVWYLALATLLPAGRVMDTAGEIALAKHYGVTPPQVVERRQCLEVWPVVGRKVRLC